MKAGSGLTQRPAIYWRGARGFAEKGKRRKIMYRNILNGSTFGGILGLSLLSALAALAQVEDPNANATCTKTTGPCGNKAHGTSTTVAGGYENIAGNNRNLTGPTTDTDAVGGGF